MSHNYRLILLTDAPAWCEPLRQAVADLAVPVQVVDVREFAGKWRPSDPFDDSWLVVVNRVSARPSHENPLLSETSQLTLFRDVLFALDLHCELGKGKGTAPRRVVNSYPCHQVGTSKCAQAALFSALGVATPKTVVVTPKTLDFASSAERGEAGENPILLLKPNVGGKGKGILTIGGSGGVPDDESISDTFCVDGVGIVQHAVPHVRDDRVFRVELLNGVPMYTAGAPVPPLTGATTFNNCLGDICTRGSKKPRDVTLVEHFAAPVNVENDTILQQCIRIAKAAKMELGSVEYIIIDADHGGDPLFIDVNPVSTLLPSSTLALRMHAEYLQRVWEAALADVSKH